ncbi:UNVERIFIED_CONTAM: hypothetical protein HDU68_007183 [Siphonaria sp. JEL0065]|nr:hypothetical protein HDU68_007183 [Siphonaria sp. JEL0065]
MTSRFQQRLEKRLRGAKTTSTKLREFSLVKDKDKKASAAASSDQIGAAPIAAGEAAAVPISHSHSPKNPLPIGTNALNEPKALPEKDKENVPDNANAPIDNHSPRKRTRHAYRASGTVPVVKIPYGGSMAKITEEAAPVQETRESNEPSVSTTTAATTAANSTAKASARSKSKRKKFFSDFDGTEEPTKPATKKRRTGKSKVKYQENLPVVESKEKDFDDCIRAEKEPAEDSSKDQQAGLQPEPSKSKNKSTKPLATSTYATAPASTTSTTTHEKSSTTPNHRKAKHLIHESIVIKQEPEFYPDYKNPANRYPNTITLKCGSFENELDVETLIACVQKGIAETREGGHGMRSLRQNVLDSLFAPSE